MPSESSMLLLSQLVAREEKKLSCQLLSKELEEGLTGSAEIIIRPLLYHDQLGLAHVTPSFKRWDSCWAKTLS